VTAISEHCASTGLIFAMHQIEVAILLRHGQPGALSRLVPRLVGGDLLLANANSEEGIGGDQRSSNCALEPIDIGFHLEKQASTISYGEYADGIVATARRDASSAAHDQVLAVCLPPNLYVKPTGDWDTLGLRGTCSRPCHLIADVPFDMVIEDYQNVFMRTALPMSAILLGSVWLGIAKGAAHRAHLSVRDRVRRSRDVSSGTTPPIGALRLAELSVPLHQMREVLAGAAAMFERHKDTPEAETLQFSGRMDNLKLSSTTLVVDIVQRAMGICGLAGFKNHSPFSIARSMRDAAAAPLMVNNDRALQATAQTLLIRKDL
jgi:acyl-CoA dehydrogenase